MALARGLLFVRRMIRDTAATDRPIEAPARGRRLALWSAAAVAAMAAIAVVAGPMAQRWLTGSASVARSRVRTAVVTRGDLVRDVSVEGRLVSASNPTLFSVAAGIVNIKVRPGELVKKDQVLAVVESPQLESLLKQERATLASLQSDYERQKIANRQQNLTNKQNAELARVTLQAAHREKSRAEQTFAEGITPEVELAKAKDDAERAALELAHAKETLTQQTESLGFELRDRQQRIERQQYVVEELERRLGDLEVRSPVDGLVGEVFVEDRDAVDERGAIVQVVDLSVFEIAIEIPEAYADEVFVGAKAEVQIGGRLEPGQVTRVAPSVTDGRVSGTATFAGDQPDGLRQNQRAAVRILLDTHPDVVKAPRGAYLEAGGHDVYVIRDGVAHRTPIVIGSRGAAEVEIVSGLEPGDEIVLSNLDRFEDADAVIVY